MKSLIFALGLSIAASPASANLTYRVDLEFVIPNMSIQGTLTTDGKMGTLSADDIVGTHLIAVIGNNSDAFFLFENETAVSVSGSDLMAFGPDLTFDFGADDGGVFSLTSLAGPFGSWCNGAAGQDICLQGLTVSTGLGETATQPFSTPTVLASTPEPSTWAMMLLGFSGVTLMGWLRTQKSPSQPKPGGAEI